MLHIKWTGNNIDQIIGSVVSLFKNDSLIFFDIPHNENIIWKYTAQMADKVQYSQRQHTRLLSGGNVCLVSHFMSTCSIIPSLPTSVYS